MGSSNLTLEPVEIHPGKHEEYALIEQVRALRNACRAYMTRHTENISAEAQVAWWQNLDHATNKLCLYRITGIDDGIVWSVFGGYGLCRLIGEKWWVSGGLGAEWQGKGLGKQLFGHLLTLTGKPCWLEVLEHNTRAFNTYRRLGFVETARDAGVITMSAT